MQHVLRSLSPHWPLALSIAVGLTSAGCGQTIYGVTPGEGGSGGEDSATNAQSASTGATPDVHPNCAFAAEDSFSATTPAEAYMALEGDWFFCQWEFGPDDAIGIRFEKGSVEPTPNGSTKGGNAFYLLNGADGSVPGSGFDYELKYDVSPFGASSVQLNIHPAPNSGFGGSVQYATQPQPKLKINWYTPLLLTK